MYLLRHSGGQLPGTREGDMSAWSSYNTGKKWYFATAEGIPIRRQKTSKQAGGNFLYSTKRAAIAAAKRNGLIVRSANIGTREHPAYLVDRA